MYFQFPFKKVALLVPAMLAVIVAVWVTFAFSSARYGELQPTAAMYRMLQKQYLFVKYFVAYHGFQPTVAFSEVFNNSFDFSRAEGAGAAGAVPVITYHAIIDEPDGENVTRESFREQMFALKRAGWQTVTLADFLEYIDGRKTLPEKSFLLTFDDGAKNSYYPVDPLLRVLDYNAVSFVLTKYSMGPGSYYYLSEGEIKSMLDTGRWEIQSHGSDSHALLPVDREGTLGAALANRLWLSEKERLETPEEFAWRTENELAESKMLLEERLGIPVVMYAFPFGDFGQLTYNHPDAENVIRDVASRVYEHALYQVWYGEGASFNYPDAERPPFMVRRIEAQDTWGGEELLRRLEAGAAKPLPFRDDFDGSNPGWLRVWGDYAREGGRLSLEASGGDTGAAAVLDGSAGWRDYRITAEVSDSSGTGAALWARYLDDANHVACNFDNEFIHIDETVNGRTSVRQGIEGGGLFPAGAHTLSMEVSGRTVRCFVNGREQLSYNFLDKTLSRGAVGVKVWEEAADVASVSLDSFSAEPLGSD